MEIQPTETLIHIFGQFPDLKSVKNCFNTCVKWQQIIEDMYKDTCKLKPPIVNVHLTNPQLYKINFCFSYTFSKNTDIKWLHTIY